MASAATGVIQPAAASDMTSSTEATLACAAQVKIAASNRVMTGSLVSRCSTSCICGDMSCGITVSVSRCSDSSTRPRPMATRPRSRVRVCPPRLKAMTPARIRIGVSSPISKDRICTITVVPTLAPSMIASAGTRSTSRPAAKEDAIIPVAVLLCRMAVTAKPAANALKRFSSPRFRLRLRLEP